MDTIPASGTGVYAFTLINPVTGAASLADSLPTGKLMRSQGGAAPAIDGAVTVTIGNTGMDTGVYYALFTVPSYTNGDIGILQIAAVMGGNTSRVTPYHFRVGIRQSGDAFARLGAPAGASTAADIAAVKTDTASALTKIGSPAGASVSADIAAVKTDTASIPSAATIAAAVWAYLKASATTVNSIGANLVAFFTALGSDNRPKVSADVHASGETVAGVTAAVTTNANSTETATAAAVAALPSAATIANTVAASILANPAHLIAVDASGNVSISAATITAIETAILDLSDGADTLTVRQALVAVLRLCVGKASGATSGSGTLHFRDLADTKDGILMVVDANGNRSSITITP